jgi:hypothetical protein
MKECQYQQNLNNSRTANLSVNAKNTRDASHRRDTSNGGSSRNRWDLKNSKTQNVNSMNAKIKEGKRVTVGTLTTEGINNRENTRNRSVGMY